MSQKTASPYQLFMLLLSIYVLLALAVQTVFALDENTELILDRADTAICLFFMADFVRSLVLAERRWQYMYTWGWLDFLSSLPALDLFRWGRGARVFRIIRVLRAVRASRMIGSLVIGQRAESALWGAVFVAILVTIFGSIAIFHLEVAHNSPIRSPDDALWWTIATITTVGYGDVYPVSPSGRVLAVAIMTVGIGFFSTCAAYVASALLAPREREQDEELELIRHELRSLRLLTEQAIASGATNRRPETDGSEHARNAEK